MAQLPYRPVLARRALREARRRRAEPRRRVDERSESISGIWRLEARSGRREERERRAASGRLRAALAGCVVVAFLGGAMSLCALALAEIAQRLVELGADGSYARDLD